MDRRVHTTLRVLVSGYLVYLAWQICTDQRAGKSTMNNALAYGAAAVLALAGAGFAIWSLIDYFRRKDADAAPDDAGEKGNDRTD